MPDSQQTHETPTTVGLGSSDLFGDGSVRIRKCRQEIIGVDATPDEEYPLRILRAYLDAADGSYVESNPPLLAEIMNQAQRERAVILRAAIARLSSPNDPSSATAAIKL